METEIKATTLLDIDREYRMVVSEIEDAGGELTPESEKALDETCVALCNKVDAYGFVQQRLESEIEFWKQNREHCTQAEKTFKRGLERLRERMRYVLSNHPEKSLQGALFRFFLASSADSLVINEEILPREYKKSIITLVPDRALIEQTLREGKDVLGASLKKDNTSLRKGKPKP